MVEETFDLYECFVQLSQLLTESSYILGLLYTSHFIGQRSEIHTVP